MIINDDYEGLDNFLKLILDEGDNDYILSSHIQIPERFYDYFSSSVILQTQKNISDQYLNRQLKSSDKHYIVQNFKLSEQLIENNLNNLNINLICSYQTLSEDFIRKHVDIFNKTAWTSISKYQILSEAFIEEFSENVDWYMIFIHQKFSKTFLEKHYKRVTLEHIFKNVKISEIFFENHYKELSAKWLIKNCKLTKKQEKIIYQTLADSL